MNKNKFYRYNEKVLQERINEYLDKIFNKKKLFNYQFLRNACYSYLYYLSIKRYQKNYSKKLTTFFFLRNLTYRKFFFNKDAVKKESSNFKNRNITFEVLVLYHDIKHKNYIKNSNIFDKKTLYKDISHINKFNIKYFLNFNNIFLNNVYMLYSNLEKFILKNKFKKIISVEGDAPYNFLISEIAKKKNIKNYCFQWGVIPDRKLKYLYSNFLFDIFFTYGKYFSDIFKKINNKTDTISLGRIDVDNNQVMAKKDSNIVLVAYQGVSSLITEKKLNLFNNLIIKLSNELNVRVIIKPHPNFPINRYSLKDFKEKNIYVSDSKKNLSELMRNASYCLSINSSSLLESVLYNVVPILYSHKDVLNLPIKKYGIGITSSSSNIICNEIKNCLENNKYKNKYIKNIDEYKGHIFSEFNKKKVMELL